MSDKESKPKYGIQELSEALGSKPNLVRIRLRRLKVKRTDGKTYGWNTQAEMNEVVKLLESATRKISAPKAATREAGRREDGKKPAAAKKTLKKAA